MNHGSKHESLPNQKHQEAFTRAFRFDAAPALDQSGKVLGPSPKECTQCCQIHMPEVRRSLQPYMPAVYPVVNSRATVHALELLLVAKLAGSLHRAAVPGGTRDSAYDTLNASLPADAL